MSTQEFAFSQEDITTVYDALQGCSAQSLAEALLGRSASQASGAKPSRSEVLAIATRRVSSLLQVLFRLGPNCEASAHVILPWRPSHLSQLSSMSWPDALGARIVVPAEASHDARSRFLADALLCISYV